MKLSGYIQVLLAITAGVCLLHPALANIYAYTENDGSVNLTNVPADDHYAIMIPEVSERPIVAGTYKPPPAIANKERYDKVVEEIAEIYGLDSALLHAVISVESRYRPDAVSSKGAAGLMQLMPLITRHYGVTDPFDPVQNLHGGAKYLRYLLKVYNNNVSLALAAYNAGETAVARYGNQIPPFRETANYVPKVLGFYRKYRAESL